ncbi:hypothetical protein CK203_017183 [Vitis vinifera]|uniref:Uncharacterized protein n=1 Tax=Vitis vinifera TaxID=29760 RepID=A0A438JZH4_VITVI|nr:hypothetical protein CK203_017183 [Vitis vinifera]
MGFLRRIAGILGFAKDEPHETRDVDDENDVVRDRTSREEVEVEDTRLPRKGFSVPAQVVIERGPLLVPCTSGEGGVQLTIDAWVLLLLAANLQSIVVILIGVPDKRACIPDAGKHSDKAIRSNAR